MPPNYRHMGQGSHTPGPWRADLRSPYGSIVATTGKGLTRATDAQNVQAYGGYLIAESVQPCNAALLAAAPDLLAAVMTAFDYLASAIGTKEETIASLWEAYKQATGVGNA